MCVHFCSWKEKVIGYNMIGFSVHLWAPVKILPWFLLYMSQSSQKTKLFYSFHSSVLGHVTSPLLLLYLSCSRKKCLFYTKCVKICLIFWQQSTSFSDILWFYYFPFTGVQLEYFASCKMNICTFWIEKLNTKELLM